MKNPGRVRMKRQVHTAGFTLIELLTVIAIISVLAGLTAVAVPRYLEKARVVETQTNMNNIKQGLSEYVARVENVNGFPPAYGYLRHQDPPATAPFVDADYVLEPYTVKIGLHGAEDVYQVGRFAVNSYDVNGDGALSLFEYHPIGMEDSATGVLQFSNVLYTGSNFPRSPEPGGLNEVEEQLAPGKARPYVYVPFNTRQLDAVERYYRRTGDEYGADFDQDATELAGRLFFPPPQYDGFVLIGNGPGGNTGGLVTVPPPNPVGGGYDPAHVYHVLGLRIAYLALRDQNDDRLLDFDYEDRKTSAPFLLPDGTNGFGAFIEYVR